jgi:tetratricopeptide (TPR) repeat protein
LRLSDSSEIDLEIDEGETVDDGAPDPHSAAVYELPLSDDTSEIDLVIDEEASSGSAPEIPDADIDESPLVGDFSETEPEIDEESTPLSLDDLLEESGVAELSSPEMVAPEPEQSTEMPEEGDDNMPLSLRRSDVDELFDLGAELRQEESGEDADTAESGKYSLDGLFSAFKQVVDQQLDQEDTETHYNLGIAYKEMGLYDDAIVEFQAAARATERAADCLTLQGICNRDKGDLDSAEQVFRKGMALEGLSTEEALSLKYELALLLEGTGRTEEALHLYSEVREVNPGFREVGSKITAMAGAVEEKASEEMELLELDVEELE